MESSKLVYPTSILDTDLYKFTMQQAVLRHFPDVQATYRFTHRDKDVFFTRECIDYSENPSLVRCSALTSVERDFLKEACPYFTSEYLDYLSAYQFNVNQDGLHGNVDIEAVGLWAETILWEVPLMACLSEIYFAYDGQEEAAYNKAETLLKAGCFFSEFGTRRRRSYHTQDTVMRALLRAAKDFPDSGKVSGTSNVHFARQYGVPPVGTIASDEWTMAGYEHANSLALDLWEDVYPDALQLALTDTFSTAAFFKDFVRNPSRRSLAGLRQDSGDAFAYAPRAAEVYAQLGVDVRTKTLIFSDALTVDKALRLKRQCDALGFTAAFGIGTSLTNDFARLGGGGAEKSRALNMVIKLAAVDGQPCVKISDELTKNTGDPEVVKRVKQILGL
ncbi:nicotinate phosphoribosyltransferase [Amylocystis lapponica]|nr:nicotinate phosphoribosyltransferase [Amylocystis lapponica]